MEGKKVNYNRIMGRREETLGKRRKRKKKCLVEFHPPEGAYTITQDLSVYQHLSGGQFPGTLAFKTLANFLFLPRKSLSRRSGFVCSYVYLNMAKFFTEEWRIYLSLYSLIDTSLSLYILNIANAYFGMFFIFILK